MSLIKYAQVYRCGSGLHVQATGPAFPTGYASGSLPSTAAVNAECDSDAGRKGVSMRPGSGSRYLPCTVTDKGVFTPKGAIVCTIEALVSALNSPSPAYHGSAATSVSESTAQAVKVGTTPDPIAAPAPAKAKVNVTELATEIAKVLAKFLN